MDEEQVFPTQFVEGIRKPYEDRTDVEMEYLCFILKKLSEFQTFDMPGLKALLKQVEYRDYSQGCMLYKPGDVADSWYYVVKGKVTISSMYDYTAGCSFGQCIDSNLRIHTCTVAEESELLQISYTPKELERFSRRTRNNSTTGSLTSSMEASISHSIEHKPATSPVPESPQAKLMGHASLSDGELNRDPLSPAKSPPLWQNREVWGIDSIAPIDQDENVTKERSGSVESDHFKFDESSISKLSQSNNSLNKAVEDNPILSDDDNTVVVKNTESEVKLRDRKKIVNRRSAPPTTQRSLRDSVGSLDYLSESQVDIDSDEDECHSETSSSPGMDSVYEVLNKPPLERTEEDIDRVMDVLQYMPAFANMTSNIRQSLFQVLLLTTFSDEGSVVIDNGDDVDKWYVVLHGHLRLQRESDPDKMYHIGESFGVSMSLKILPHRGRLVTASKDCQLCYVTADDYGRVLAQGEENLKRVEENGQIVAVLERRAVSAKREGYFVVQATPNKLLDYLLEEGVDDTFHTDFLLTYRSFLDSPASVLEQIRNTWSGGLPQQRERIIKIVLNWVSDHYMDFECNDMMLGFLDWFEDMLIEDGKIGEKRILDEARIVHSRTRLISIDREGVAAPLEFDIVGGWELLQPVFVSEVAPQSRPYTAGLKRGDQILAINDTKCEQRELREVLNILQKNYKLELKVKSNIPRFKQFMSEPSHENTTAASAHSHLVAPPPAILRSNSTSSTSRSNVTTPTRTAPSNSADLPRKQRKGFFRPIVKTFSKGSVQRFRTRLRNTQSIESGQESPSGPLKARKLKARNSQENLLEDKTSNGAVMRPATSAEDIHVLAMQESPKLHTRTRSNRSSRAYVVDAVVKLYAPDHSVKYFDVTSSTTVAEVIARGVKEFFPERFVASPADEFCICMVTVTSRTGPIRNSVLPGHLTDLANFIELESRFYLKERAYHGTLVQDEEAERIVKESRQWETILNLKAMQIAEELTRTDSEIFSSIGPSEFIADLWKNPELTAREHLSVFEEIPNDEMYWVVTTVVSETNGAIRAKIIKHFIKIAKCCKILKNFNSMFHIISGLNHGLVQRLKSSWEKVPHKYKRSMEDLTSYMNPFHNMSKYRELQRQTKPPLIPFFPIIKKDLTFLFDGNDTIVNGLINFEKLRMLSKQIRSVKAFCEHPIKPTAPEVDLSQLGVINRTINSLHGSLRWKQRSPHNMVTMTENALKKVYNYHRMAKMVQKHLSRKYVLKDEIYLEQIVDSQEKLQNVTRRNPPSPVHRAKKSLSVIDKKHRSTTISPSHTGSSFCSDAPSIDLSPSIITIPPHSSTSSSLSAMTSPPGVSLDDDGANRVRSSSVSSLTSTSSAPPK